MGTHLIELNESYPMNTYLAGFRWFSKKSRVLVLWTKMVSALEGLIVYYIVDMAFPQKPFLYILDTMLSISLFSRQIMGHFLLGRT